MKRVDDEVVGLREPAPRRASQQEVPRKIDAFDAYAGPPGDFHIDHRQRDRNAGAPVEDFVQEAVARIFVRDAVADEAQLAEEVLVERHHTRVVVRIGAGRRVARRLPGRIDPLLGFTADRVDAIEIRPRIEAGILDARNHQRRDREVRVGAERRVGEAANQLRLDHRITSSTG